MPGTPGQVIYLPTLGQLLSVNARIEVMETLHAVGVLAG